MSTTTPDSSASPTDSSAAGTDLSREVRQIAENARVASRDLVAATGQQKIDWLTRVAEAIRTRTDEVIAANERDLAKAPDYGLTDAMIDRLRLTEARLESIADAVTQIASLPDPLGRVLGSQTRPNGLVVQKVSVPLGVVFFIYESRPNVTIDAAALCVKSGNAVILRGGKEAFHSNHAFGTLLRETLAETGLPTDAVQLVPTTDRAAVGHFLSHGDLIDVAIPRGGKSLIERVAAEATMPVIKHFDGICHVYVDESADPTMAVEIVENSKCQRTGVCNAAESLLVHRSIADEFLPTAARVLIERGVELRGDEQTRKLVPEAIAITPEDDGTEYLDLILSVRVVDSLSDAIAHINTHGSGHTDAIVTRDLNAARDFQMRVDSSAVIVNASTRFNDGGEFGLGAEIGISTDKFHARGPCGLEELTSYKYLVHGAGQIRN